MAINLNKKTELEQKVEENKKDKKTLLNQKKELDIKQQQGRPRKFKEPLAANVKIGFTQEQLTKIDKRMDELGLTVRLDYLRSLIKKDISDF
jgi:hypothetical protein